MQVEEVTFRSSGTELEDFEKEFSCHIVMLFMELGCIGWCGWVFLVCPYSGSNGKLPFRRKLFLELKFTVKFEVKGSESERVTGKGYLA